MVVNEESVIRLVIGMLSVDSISFVTIAIAITVIIEIVVTITTTVTAVIRPITKLSSSIGPN